MSKQNLIEKYKSGDKLEVRICKPKHGNFPIAKTENDGVICLFERIKKFFVIGSTWKVEVTKVNDNSLFIKPIKQIRTVEENENEVTAKLNELKANGIAKGNLIFK